MGSSILEYVGGKDKVKLFDEAVAARNRIDLFDFVPKALGLCFLVQPECEKDRILNSVSASVW